MSLKSRRAFFYIYIGLFSLAAPLVVLYTAGYRFDFLNQRLVQVGALIVSSVPKGATVSLDGQEQPGRTPLINKRLLPGSYELTLSKDGYQSWQREIVVQSRQTTEVQNAVLFLNTEPELIKDLHPSVFAAKPDGSVIAYGVKADSWFELWTYSPTSQEFFLLDRLSSSKLLEPELHWSHDGYLLILEDGTGAFNKQFFYTNQGPLETSPDWFASWSFVKQSGHVALNKTTGVESQTVAILPPGHYLLSDVYNNMLLVHDWQTERLILVDAATNGPPILLNAEATFYHWHGTNLLYGDGTELHLYNPSINSDILITRSGVQILDAVPFPEGQAILTVTPTTITASDISDPGRPVNTLIVAVEIMKAFWLDTRGRNGYFFGTVDGQNGLYQLPLTR